MRWIPDVGGPLLALAALASPLGAQEVPPRPEPRVPIEPLAPHARPGTGDGGPPAPLARPDALDNGARLAPGWTLRSTPDGSLLALGGGPGRVVSLSAFCLGGAPWLALELEPPPAADRLRADFAFSAARVDAEALREDGAGGAYVIELAGSRLPDLLAGSDAAAALAIDGTQQGSLSLAGSSASLRAALEDCHGF